MTDNRPGDEKNHLRSDTLGWEQMAGIVQHQLAEYYDETKRHGTTILCVWPRNEVNEGGDVEQVWYEVPINVGPLRRIPAP